MQFNVHVRTHTVLRLLQTFARLLLANFLLFNQIKVNIQSKIFQKMKVTSLFKQMQGGGMGCEKIIYCPIFTLHVP